MNLLGVVRIIRAFLPAMLAADGARHLVNVASAAGLHAMSNLSARSASKHVVLGFSDAPAVELGHMDASVTVVCPGVINTPIIRNRRAMHAGGRTAKLAFGPACPHGRRDDLAQSVLLARPRLVSTAASVPELSGGCAIDVAGRPQAPTSGA